MHAYGERVRGIGIPFGETREQIDESVLLQLTAGVLGLRVDPRALLEYPSIAQYLGEHGRWLYAIGATDSDEVMAKLVKWLERYPLAHIAAPHFLKPHALFCEGEDNGLVRALVSHPHFHPIFSRHGGMGSLESYPHKDFAPWVNQVIATAGWDSVLWGSEYPVYTWRDETMGSCVGWLPALLGTLIGDQLASFLYHNTQRLIFDQPAPQQQAVIIPTWVDQQFNRDRVVPLFPDGFHIPMHIYHKLHHRYVIALKHNPNLPLSTFITQMIDTSKWEDLV